MVDQLLTGAFLISIAVASVRMASPLLIAALGESLAERSGMLNLGLEGMMIMSAYSAFSASQNFGNPVLGLAAAVLTGAAMAAVYSLLTIRLYVNQIVCGLVMVILGDSLSTFLYRTSFGLSAVAVTVPGFEPISLPVLGQIPVVGTVFFDQDIFTYTGLLLVPIVAILLYKTKYGVRIRAIGENPLAADTQGIDVIRYRYILTIFGGALCGIAGAFFPLGYMFKFYESMTGGRGWIAIALVIFGRWDPVQILLGALLFGAADALQFRLQAVGTPIPFPFLLMLPYVLTIIVMIRVHRRAGVPAALGIPYKRGEK